jgi:hypothetical protein
MALFDQSGVKTYPDLGGLLKNFDYQGVANRLGYPIRNIFNTTLYPTGGIRTGLAPSTPALLSGEQNAANKGVGVIRNLKFPELGGLMSGLTSRLGQSSSEGWGDFSSFRDLQKKYQKGIDENIANVTKSLNGVWDGSLADSLNKNLSDFSSKMRTSIGDLGSKLSGARSGFTSTMTGLADTQRDRLRGNLDELYGLNKGEISGLKGDLLTKAQELFNLGNTTAGRMANRILGDALSRRIANTPYAMAQAAAQAADTGTQLAREKTAMDAATISGASKAMQELNAMRAAGYSDADIRDAAMRAGTAQTAAGWERDDASRVETLNQILADRELTQGNANLTLPVEMAARYANVLPQLGAQALSQAAMVPQLRGQMMGMDLSGLSGLTNIMNSAYFTGLADNNEYSPQSRRPRGNGRPDYNDNPYADLLWRDEQQEDQGGGGGGGGRGGGGGYSGDSEYGDQMSPEEYDWLWNQAEPVFNFPGQIEGPGAGTGEGWY